MIKSRDVPVQFAHGGGFQFQMNGGGVGGCPPMTGRSFCAPMALVF